MKNTSYRPKALSIEWPTWLLIVFVYGAWITLVSGYNFLPGAAIMLVLINTLHASIQHELIHGHPTRLTWLNGMLAYPPLSLWYPYPLYRESHIVHHNDEIITLPGLDPESFYVSQARWETLGFVRRGLLVFNMTLAGRMLIGPAISLTQLSQQAYRAFASFDRPQMRTWTLHFVLVCALLYSLSKYADIRVWQYFAIAYASQSLTMLRSFYEHRASKTPPHRSVLVEASWPMRLLFTNNNYHLLHHDQPDMAWYRLPAHYRQQREQLKSRNGGFIVKGYRQWWLRNLITPIDHPRHPFY